MPLMKTAASRRRQPTKQKPDPALDPGRARIPEWPWWPMPEQPDTGRPPTPALPGTEMQGGGGYRVSPAQTQQLRPGLNIEYPETRVRMLGGQQGATQAPTQQFPEMQYFQPPPYVGPEDIQRGGPTGVPTWQEPGGEQPQFYSFSEGDYDALENMLFERGMRHVTEEMGGRGMIESSYYAQAAGDVAGQALGQRMGLQAAEQARHTRWEQEERLRTWAEGEQQLRGQLSTYGAASQEAAQRRDWLWNTYTMQHGDYWRQISTMLQSILMPYQTVPYQGVQNLVPFY